jgi:hypothetical protein
MSVLAPALGNPSLPQILTVCVSREVVHRICKNPQVLQKGSEGIGSSSTAP